MTQYHEVNNLKVYMTQYHEVNKKLENLGFTYSIDYSLWNFSCIYRYEA